MRVFAIGATGFIGSQVVSRLVLQGHEVAVLHRGETVAPLHRSVQVLHGNRDKLYDARAHIESFAPDVVFDAILYTEQQARALVDVCRGRTARIVALSSADVYRNYDGLRGVSTDEPDPVPLTEEAPVRRTRYPYRGAHVDFEYAHDYDKLLVEEVFLQNPDTQSTVLRLPAVYGPGDRQHRLRRYLQQMFDGGSTIVLQQEQCNWRWTRSFVVNVAAAVALAITDARGAGRVYNIGEDPALTEREWVEAIGGAAGWKGEVVSAPAGHMRDDREESLDWRYSLWTDCTRIRRELGYAEPVSLVESVDRTVAWERSTLTALGR